MTDADRRYVRGDAPAPRVCYRCDDRLEDRHWLTLSTRNRGQLAGGFDDVDRPICPDCAAAVGLLEPVVDRR